MPRRYDREDAKRRILSVCVKLFIERGYEKTTTAEILEKADEVLPEVLRTFGDKYEIAKCYEGMIDFTPKGVDKGSVVAALAGIWGISADEIVTIGDECNDIPMLKAAGISVEDFCHFCFSETSFRSDRFNHFSLVHWDSPYEIKISRELKYLTLVYIFFEDFLILFPRVSETALLIRANFSKNFALHILHK